MNISAALVIMNNHFNASFSTVDVVYQNTDFDVTTVDEFVKFDPIFADSKQVSLAKANQNFRQKGVLSIQIFTAPGQGSKRSADLTDEISTIWRAKNISSIIFSAPDTVIVGNTQDGFFQTNLLVDFYFDTI